MTSIEDEARAEAERFNEDAEARFAHDPSAHGVDEWSFIAGALWAASRQPSEGGAGCPHEACEIDSAGNPTRCADCGDDLEAAPEPSEADGDDEISVNGGPWVPESGFQPEPNTIYVIRRRRRFPKRDEPSKAEWEPDPRTLRWMAEEWITRAIERGSADHVYFTVEAYARKLRSEAEGLEAARTARGEQHG